MTQIKGEIIVIGETTQVTEKFSKRDLVVLTKEETYPQTIPMQFTQDKCSVLDGYNIGDMVDVSVNIQGRDWVNPQGETKYFLSLNAWRIEKFVGSAPTQGNIEKRFEDEAIDTMTQDDDDLPF